ncbi:MAG: triose-phosphate isomerase [Anaerolineae bacterium]
MGDWYGTERQSDFAQQVIGGTIRGTLACFTAPKPRNRYAFGTAGVSSRAIWPITWANPDIDGALVGGASLAVADFTTLVRIAAEVKGA